MSKRMIKVGQVFKCGPKKSENIKFRQMYSHILIRHISTFEAAPAGQLWFCTYVSYSEGGIDSYLGGNV